MNKYFESICAAMASPDFYPHFVSSIERKDTHISAVFLTGQWVYKLKKPLNLGFLDFSRLKDRHHFCKQEIFLNQRFSHNIYKELVKIYKDSQGCFSFEKKGDIVEYAVKMKQLPDSASLKNLLKKDKISKENMKNLGEMLADFYTKTIHNPEIDKYGSKDIISFNIEENFQHLAPYSGRLFQDEKWQFICQVNRSFIKHFQNLFQYRVNTGKIKDGHGDLRTDHIYFYNGVQIIDCIEFNNRFRYGDIAVDLAFLHMDMEYRGYGKLSRDLLYAYAEKAKDPEIYTLIDFYAAYRAVVRLKVACIRYQEVREEEKKALKKEINCYMNLAYLYTLRFSRLCIWVFCGLPASGKSKHAKHLAELLSIPLFQSDAIRKQIQPKQKVESFGQHGYSKEKRHRIYVKMLNFAQKELKHGCSVILDATYSKQKWRKDVVQLAHDIDANLIFVECVCSDKILRQRLKKRETSKSLSDARIWHLPQMRLEFEPLKELEVHEHIKVNTDQPVEKAFLKIVAKSYACKSIQTNNSKN